MIPEDTGKDKKGRGKSQKSRLKVQSVNTTKKKVWTRRLKTPGRTTKSRNKATEVRKQRVSATPRKPSVKSETSTPADLKWVEDDPKDHLLSRFIYDHNGNIIGESIGVEGKQLIMKSGSKFYSVPLRNIKEGGNELTVKGRINKTRARKLGEIWRKKALDPLYQKKK